MPGRRGADRGHLVFAKGDLKDLSLFSLPKSVATCRQLEGAEYSTTVPISTASLVL